MGGSKNEINVKPPPAVQAPARAPALHFHPKRGHFGPIVLSAAQNLDPWLAAHTIIHYIINLKVGPDVRHRAGSIRVPGVPDAAGLGGGHPGDGGGSRPPPLRGPLRRRLAGAGAPPLG